MISKPPLYQVLPADSFLEYAFLRWVLYPAVKGNVFEQIAPQYKITIEARNYRLDYAIFGQSKKIAIELDGFEYHSSRQVFSYDRLRQNDLQAGEWAVVRFSYDSIRTQTARCIAQLQAIMTLDPLLKSYLIPYPVVEIPEMNPDPIYGIAPLSIHLGGSPPSYFDQIRLHLNLVPLRECQQEAFHALANYFHTGGKKAACIMSVGAGKTALGIVACLGFTRKRALIITPGSVIRGTFDQALDTSSINNVLYMLPGGPLLPGNKPPQVLTLDRKDGTIKSLSRAKLLQADIIVTNFHSLGTEDNPDDLISKLQPQDIDLIVVDEAHIAAADSYQRTFEHFKEARQILMSACFQRLDGKPIEADVVYRYRLIDSIADGHAKNLRVQRFAPEAEETIYEVNWPDGRKEEITGRAQLLEIIEDERKIAYITAKSDSSLRQIIQAVKITLDKQARYLAPVKPRVLFSAIGEKHAAQIARIANSSGIPCDYLHYSMSDAHIESVRNRFEKDSGNLQGVVQLKMLGQGYDFPPITIVVPLRPYGSFGEFYQFIGRGIRNIRHPELEKRLKAGEQYLDIIYHAEMALDNHIEIIYQDNDINTLPGNDEQATVEPEIEASLPYFETQNSVINNVPNAVVVFEQGIFEQRIIHDEIKIEQRKVERELESFAQKYAIYVQSTSRPVSFEQYVTVMRKMSVRPQ